MLKDRKDLRILVLFNKTLASVSSIKYVLAFVSETGEYSSLPAVDKVFSAFLKIFVGHRNIHLSAALSKNIKK